MLSDIIFHKATHQPSINEICQELRNQVTLYYQLLGDIRAIHPEPCSFASTIRPLIDMQARIEALSSLLKFLSQTRRSVNQHTEENIKKTEELLLELSEDCSHSRALLNIYQKVLASTSLSSEQRTLIEAAIKTLPLLLRVSASINPELDSLVHESNRVAHHALHAKKSFLQNWVFSLHPEELRHFGQKNLDLLQKNAMRLEKILEQKFGGMSASDYAVSLEASSADIILKFGPRELRKRVFEGLQKLIAIHPSESHDRQVLERIIKLIKLRNAVALTCGFESFSEFSQHIRPLGINYSQFQSTYSQLLPLVHQKAQQEFELLHSFALKHDATLEFQSWDLNYYLQLEEQTSCPEQPDFEIARMINLINEKMLELFNLELRMIEQPAQSPEENIILLELLNQGIREPVGTIQCDIFRRSGKKKRTDKKVFIVENVCLEAPITVFLCSFFEKKETQSLSFADILTLSKDIGSAVALLLWRQKTSNRLMLKMIPDDMWAVISILFASWHLETQKLATHYPSVSLSVLNTLIQAYERRETLALLQDLQIGYFDSIIDSTSYVKLLTDNPDKYSPAKLWERVCADYNLEAEETLSWTISPLSHGILFGKSLLKHISIISKIYFAQLSETLRQAPSSIQAGSVLLDCFFGEENPSNIAQRLQLNFFKESVNPLYLGRLYQNHAKSDISSETSSAIVFSQATQSESTPRHYHRK